MSREMQLAVDAIFRSDRFRSTIHAIVQKELGAALAPIVYPALIASLERDLPREFMEALTDLYAGSDLGYVPKTAGHAERAQRNRLVMQALAAGVPVPDVARRFNISSRHVQRISSKVNA